MFPGPLGLSLAGRGLENNFWSLETVNIRDFADVIILPCGLEHGIKTVGDSL